MYIINPYRYAGNLYVNVQVVYSLRKFNNWSNAVLQIRRSSDDATAYVFFNGSSPSNLITLNGYISTSSITTPDTSPNVTLSTWIGSDDGFVSQWVGQLPDNITDSGLIPAQGTNGSQPQFISSGTIITKNSLPAIDFTSTTKFLSESASNPALDSGNTFTVFSVSHSNSTTDSQTVWSTRPVAGSNLTVTNDRRSNKRCLTVFTTSSFVADLTSQVDSDNQRLLTALVTSTDIECHYNGTLQNTTGYTGTYTNGAFRIGLRSTDAFPLDGTVQEIIIFASDKTTDFTELHNEIDTYYSIP